MNPKNGNAQSYSPPPGQKAPEGLASENTADMAKRYTWIPELYADPDKTTLTIEVKRGSHEHDIKLE